MKKTKLGSKFWMSLTVFSLIGQIAWVVENMYFNVFIYKMFHASAGAISLMVAASAIAAALTTLFMGALSDKLGKRKLFICGGYVLWGVSIWSFALIRTDVIHKLFPAAVSAASVGVSLVVVMDCVMTFFGSTANDACFNAWLTDSTDENNRGAAEGVNAMMPLIAILAVFGGFMSFDLDQASSWVTIYTLIGVVVILIGVLGFFVMKEPRIECAGNKSWLRNLCYGFRPSVMKENAAFYLTLAAFAVFGISIQIFMPYLILYYEVSLGMENYVMIMAPAILLAAVATFFCGRLYDRFGFKTTILPALGLLGGGYLLLFFTRATVPVFLGSLLMMSGYLAGMAVFGAKLRECTPAGKAGMFQGLRIIGQVLIPGVIGPWIGAWVLQNADTIVNSDGTVSFIPHAGIFLAALIAGIFVLPAALLIFRRERSR